MVFLSHGGAGHAPGEESWKEHKAISESLIYIFRKMRFWRIGISITAPWQDSSSQRNDSTSDLPWVSSDHIRKWFWLCTTCEKAVPWHAALSFASLFTTWERLVEHEGESPDRMWMKRNDTWAGVPWAVRPGGGVAAQSALFFASALMS